ncbi:MAG: hypothetical protein PWP07_1226 [Epulopiscium sp.]|jgi:hypothetical protein|uniref:hypothetical protein n=1 Tax=Defluviitalea raffinosedens TaxID=1450156 RepID=UPI00176DE9F3|nr:hypothetical protein [Defluviitalea raffinosedens]MBM7685342.1 hypothetical protein [Defluviitalea raffinosedens]MBZ4667245.1 hypothetical protein [Defluviitaleaceae bacterium]MDK2788001.1 hypothetical protein [Candidatus Epulonipiscium sp.]HHW66336.1 hypothetical protein [Candidatus Epulonipiscium sp.]
MIKGKAKKRLMVIGAVSSYFMRLSLLDEMKKKGLILSKEFINRTEESFKALDIINKLVNHQLIITAKTVIRNQDHRKSSGISCLIKNKW